MKVALNLYELIRCHKCKKVIIKVIENLTVIKKIYLFISDENNFLKFL